MLTGALLQIIGSTNGTPASCIGPNATEIVRKADLPAQVIALLPEPMAELGEPYSAGDISFQKLPTYRFVSAVWQGCGIRVSYEGGRWEGKITAVFNKSGSRWEQATP